jgi:hypothetical protein
MAAQFVPSSVFTRTLDELFDSNTDIFLQYLINFITSHITVQHDTLVVVWRNIISTNLSIHLSRKVYKTCV